MYLIHLVRVLSCSRRNKGCNVVIFCTPVSHSLNGGIMGAQFVVCNMVGPHMARKKVYLILHCKLSVTRKEVAYVINLKKYAPRVYQMKTQCLHFPGRLYCEILTFRRRLEPLSKWFSIKYC